MFLLELIPSCKEWGCCLILQQDLKTKIEKEWQIMLLLNIILSVMEIRP